jgi:sigma-B regulation protein RsbU (phosphoserine phosphatase)
MSYGENWRKDLSYVADMMRDVSRQSDPQKASMMYGERLRKGGFFPSDGYISLSRRDLKQPQYRITRSSTWKENIHPWKEKDRLPLLNSGLLGELLYSNEPHVIDDLQKRLSPSDPAYEYMRGMNMLIAAPHYDDGIAQNMGITLIRDPATVPMGVIPSLVLQANLWGRAVRNLVLRQELATAYEALNRELTIVGQIQQTLLPATLPSIPGIQLAAHYRTATRSGGDYYDFFPADDHRWGIFIADVSGHGTPAAVIMAITHAIAHLHPGAGIPPREMLGFINQHLATRYIGGSGAFVTAFYGIYDAEARTLTYARAGHNPPRLLRGKSTVGLDQVGGLPLGIHLMQDYDECVVPSTRWTPRW